MNFNRNLPSGPIRRAVKKGLMNFNRNLPSGPIVTTNDEPQEITTTRNLISSNLEYYSNLNSKLSGIVRNQLPVAINNSKQQINDGIEMVLNKRQVKTTAADVPTNTVHTTVVTSMHLTESGRIGREMIQSEEDHNLAVAVANSSSSLVDWTPSPLIKQLDHSTSSASHANLSISLLNTPEGYYDQL
jgi:hypothetical protein